jgi:hypothetical protein
MRYQLRLLDLTLPELTRRIAFDAREAVDELLGMPPRAGLYRELYRALRGTFVRRLQANRYCGGAMSCEHSLLPGAPKVKHEDFPGARVRVLLTEEDVSPELLVGELEGAMVKAAARSLPGKKLKGLAPALKRLVEKALKGRIFRSDLCGVSPLCAMNEPYDPWDRREALVRPVRFRAAR